VRRITDDAAWVPRTFDPAEPGSIDMWSAHHRPVTQPQIGREGRCVMTVQPSKRPTRLAGFPPR